MTNHVPTLEMSQKLKAAGFPQESYFQWAREWNKPESHSDRHLLTDWLFITMHDYRPLGTKIERVAAPILTEILEQLPWELKDTNDDGRSISRYLGVTKGPTDYRVGWEVDLWKDHSNPAEAAALLWLELKGRS